MAKRSRFKDLLEFEIIFYERLLQDHPDFVDALQALGEAYTRLGVYDKGLAIDQKLTQLKGSDPIAWYNLGCSYALLKHADEAFEAIRKAIECGYDDFDYLLKDPDLSSLRESPKLRRLLEQRVPSRPAS